MTYPALDDEVALGLALDLLLNASRTTPQSTVTDLARIGADQLLCGGAVASATVAGVIVDPRVLIRSALALLSTLSDDALERDTVLEAIHAAHRALGATS